MLSTEFSPLNYGIFSRTVPTKRVQQAPAGPSPQLRPNDFLRVPPSEESSQLGLNYRTHEQAGINGRRTVYEFDPHRNRNVIKVIDTETNEEIRQMPGPDSRSLAQTVESFHRNRLNLTT